MFSCENTPNDDVDKQDDGNYVEIFKGRISYSIYGSGKPLVFLNGGPGISSEGYRYYAEELSQYRKVILFDQRGTGKSNIKNPDNVGIDNMVEDLEVLRKHLKIEKWDVFGHSFGGQYAMHYVSKYSEHVNKVILSASPAFTEPRVFGHGSGRKELSDFPDPYKLGQFKDLEEELFGKNATDESKQYADNFKFAPRYSSNPDNYHAVAKWFYLYAGKHERTSRRVNLSLVIHHLQKDKLEKIDLPVLVIHGRSDFVKLINAEMNHEVFPNARLEIIEDSGHMMAIDQPTKYFGLIEEFLNKDY